MAANSSQRCDIWQITPIQNQIWNVGIDFGTADSLAEHRQIHAQPTRIFILHRAFGQSSSQWINNLLCFFIFLKRQRKRFFIPLEKKHNLYIDRKIYWYYYSAFMSFVFVYAFFALAFFCWRRPASFYIAAFLRAQKRMERKFQYELLESKTKRKKAHGIIMDGRHWFSSKITEKDNKKHRIRREKMITNFIQVNRIKLWLHQKVQMSNDDF